MENFEQIKELILHYVRGIWINRWIAIAIAWPILIVGVIFVDQIKDRYQAETKVYIDSSSVLRPLLRGLAIETDFESNVRLMVKKLLTRPNLERAIRLMDMDINTKSTRDMDALIENVKSRVDISTQSRSGIYIISYQDELPGRAKKMVRTLLDIFVEDTLGDSAKDSDTAIAFLDNQIAKYDQLLQEAEVRLESFKRENVGVLPKDGANYYNQLQSIKAQYEQAALELSESKNRRDKLASQLS
ncbi:MAG: chain length-determining protein, partial [Gammaproteobacteria bacterium]|nr:chain length-determining protein [Gammaproteobacteria bacterium]